MKKCFVFGNRNSSQWKTCQSTNSGLDLEKMVFKEVFNRVKIESTETDDGKGM